MLDTATYSTANKKWWEVGHVLQNFHALCWWQTNVIASRTSFVVVTKVLSVNPSESIFFCAYFYLCIRFLARKPCKALLHKAKNRHQIEPRVAGISILGTGWRVWAKCTSTTWLEIFSRNDLPTTFNSAKFYRVGCGHQEANSQHEHQRSLFIAMKEVVFYYVRVSGRLQLIENDALVACIHWDLKPIGFQLPRNEIRTL